MQQLILLAQFMKIGLFSIGGGLATLPFLYELARNTNYITSSQLTDMIAISQCTPGPIGINIATYIGQHNNGIIGGITTTLALVFPSFIIICIISKMLKKYEDSKFIKKLFSLLRPCAIGFMLSALFSIVLIAIFNSETISLNLFNTFNLKAFTLMIILLVCVFKFKHHPLFYLLISGIIGILINL